jgi:hypothetical protein
MCSGWQNYVMMCWRSGGLKASPSVYLLAAQAASSSCITHHDNCLAAGCCCRVLRRALQACADGSLLDIQLAGGAPHVVLISLLHTLHELRYHYASMGMSPCVSKVLLRLALQVRGARGVRCWLALSPLTCIVVWTYLLGASTPSMKSSVHTQLSLYVGLVNSRCVLLPAAQPAVLPLLRAKMPRR